MLRHVRQERRGVPGGCHFCCAGPASRPGGRRRALVGVAAAGRAGVADLRGILGAREAREGLGLRRPGVLRAGDVLGLQGQEAAGLGVAREGLLPGEARRLLLRGRLRRRLLRHASASARATASGRVGHPIVRAALVLVTSWPGWLLADGHPLLRHRGQMLAQQPVLHAVAVQLGVVLEQPPQQPVLRPKCRKRLILAPAARRTGVSRGSRAAEPSSGAATLCRRRLWARACETWRRGGWAGKAVRKAAALQEAVRGVPELLELRDAAAAPARLLAHEHAVAVAAAPRRWGIAHAQLRRAEVMHVAGQRRAV
mmetsp:Transcript_121165/g.354107  ORF Transcript_121165/g.354107 Transcript_121165/m.354107 type:complete len:312 (+) Transcript_121165:1203-2138(+)